MKVVIVAGARPNFMKVAPLIRAIETRNQNCCTSGSKIQYTLVHTGQHYDVQMSKVFFNDLGLPLPHFNLEVGSASHAVQTANIMVTFEKVCLDVAPDWVIVVGDVNSTMACTLVAAKMGIRVGHVEAGLRSFDRTMPEEINRIVTDALADLLFTPSEDANENLLREGVASDKIKLVGNIMIDSLMSSLIKAQERKAYKCFGLECSKYALVTIHRPANTDNSTRLVRIMEILAEVSEEVPIIFPVHPRTRTQLDCLAGEGCYVPSERMKIVEPLGYLDFISVLESCLFALTDSGGLQEETTFMGIPCLTLRENTERPVTIRQGTNKLTSLERLRDDVNNVFREKKTYGSIPEFWDGLTASRIVDILAQAG